MSNAALILAAGRGERIQNFTPDKTLAPLAGRPAIAYSLEAFRQSGCVETIVIIFRDEPQQKELYSALAESRLEPEKCLWVKGGPERQESVLNGLMALPQETARVFIHDAARPLVTPEAVRLLAEKVAHTGAAALARRVTDTIKQTRPAADLALEAFVLRTVDRSSLWAIETPQVFDHSLILAAYQKISAAGLRITDDTAALEKSGQPVTLVETDFPNPKITTAGDIPYLDYLLASGRTGLAGK